MKRKQHFPVAAYVNACMSTGPDIDITAALLPNPTPETRALPGRAFFVTVMDGNRRGFLAGPYATWGGAEAAKRVAKKKAEPGDPFNRFAYGTAQAPADTETLFGKV